MYSFPLDYIQYATLGKLLASRFRVFLCELQWNIDVKLVTCSICRSLLFAVAKGVTDKLQLCGAVDLLKYAFIFNKHTK